MTTEQLPTDELITRRKIIERLILKHGFTWEDANQLIGDMELAAIISEIEKFELEVKRQKQLLGEETDNVLDK